MQHIKQIDNFLTQCIEAEEIEKLILENKQNLKFEKRNFIKKFYSERIQHAKQIKLRYLYLLN